MVDIAAKEDGNVRVFLMADAVCCAKDHQKVPEGYYNTQFMLSKIVRKGDAALCGTSIDVRRLAESELIEDAKRSTMAQLADCMQEADKVLVF